MATNALIPLGAASLLLLGVFELPYGYYTFLRLAVTAAAIVLMILMSKFGEIGWCFGLLPVALLWNPIITVSLSRSVWLPLDLLAAAFFLTLAFRMRRAGGVKQTS